MRVLAKSKVNASLNVDTRMLVGERPDVLAFFWVGSISVLSFTSASAESKGWISFGGADCAVAVGTLPRTVVKRKMR